MTAHLRPGVHQVEAGDGSILLDEHRGTYYHLNETATRMLALLLTCTSTAAVVERLATVYDAEPRRLAGDLDALVRRLCDAGLVSA